MCGRNRAEGWKYAKLTGHENERLVKELLDTNKQYAREFLQRIDLDDKVLVKTSIGGLHEHNVASVIGRKTKSKTDLKLFFDDETFVNISIKKSLSGQVYFIRATNFINVFQTQFNKCIPENICRAIYLFWAAAPDAVEIIEKYADKNRFSDYHMQIRHGSLNADTLKRYNEGLYHDLLQWFKDNMYELTYLCFAAGAVQDKNEWSNFVWYKNMLGENEVDAVFNIIEISKAASCVSSDEVYYGTSNGGTTIQLPFGFVQWHQGQLQFHHNYTKVRSMLEK